MSNSKSDLLERCIAFLITTNRQKTIELLDLLKNIKEDKEDEQK